MPSSRWRYALSGVASDTTVTPRLSNDVTKRIGGDLKYGVTQNLTADVTINTDRVGGPSAGLAFTLAIIDDLTPGDLSGGKRVAVTGTISEDGSVGEIGGISQKATSAKAAGAEVFIVPACARTDIKKECERDLAKAKERAGDLQVIPVATFDEALKALQDIGQAALMAKTAAAP